MPALMLNGRNYSGGAGINFDVYKPSGSVYFANLPPLGANVLNNAYDIKDDFTTTADFVEGAGVDYAAGTNVAIINIGTSANPIYKYDALSGSYQIIQVASLPNATSAEEGNIYQFIGTTTQYYTNGFFYKCIEDPENVGTYIWTNINVQNDEDSVIQYAELPTAASTLVNTIVQYIGATENDLVNGYFYKCIEDPDDLGSYIWIEVSVMDAGSGSLGDALTAAIDVGGISAGSSFNAGTTYDDLWDYLLNPTLYPTLTAPSATISGTGSKILETGGTIEATITVTFNRGSISPAYGTNGYRSGAAESYTLNGGTAQSGNTFTEIVSGSNKTFQATVSYAAGEQPKDSKGGNYESALAAGSVNTSSLSYEFVNALWANTANIATIAKLALVSKSTKLNRFEFPAATVANPEVFDVPASWTVTAVEVLNTLSNQWENCASQFTITDTTHDDAGGTSTAYKRYTCNLGYAMGARSIRIKWS